MSRVVQLGTCRILVTRANDPQKFNDHLQRSPPMLAIHDPEHKPFSDICQKEERVSHLLNLDVSSAEFAIPNVTHNRLNNVIALQSEVLLNVLQFSRNR